MSTNSTWDSLGADDKKFGLCMALTREKCGGDANAWDNYATCKTNAFPSCMNDTEDKVYGVPRQQKYNQLFDNDISLALNYATNTSSYKASDKTFIEKIRVTSSEPAKQTSSMCLAVSREGCGDWNATVATMGYDGSSCKTNFADCVKSGTWGNQPVKDVYENVFKNDYTLARQYMTLEKQVEPEYRDWIRTPFRDMDTKPIESIGIPIQNSGTPTNIPVTEIHGISSNSNLAVKPTSNIQPIKQNAVPISIPGMQSTTPSNSGSSPFVQGKVEACALNMISRASNPSTCIADLIAVKGVSSTDTMTINEYKDRCAKAGDLPVKFFHDVCKARTDAENNVWKTKQNIIQ